MHPQLERDAKGEWVTYLQTLLEQAEFSPGPIDGDFGPRTEAAVRSYQGAHDLKVDGIVGPITWGALDPASSDADAETEGPSAADGGGADQESDETPSLGLRLTATELDTCEVPEMEDEEADEAGAQDEEVVG